MHLERASGIVLHPTSLPSSFGVGDLGRGAYAFIDFLVDAGQSLWQTLPLGPTGFGNSPYMSLSAFAGNGLLISLERLVDEGLLDAEDLRNPPRFPKHHVDYRRVMTFKGRLLAQAFSKFRKKYATHFPDEFYAFCEHNAFWLEDYALFSALKGAHGGRVWTGWEDGASTRDTDALVGWRNRLADEVQYCKFVQYEFFRQWTSLKAYCNDRGVRIIGDVPVYVAHDSAEVWANRDLFELDGEGNPRVVAGVPPDYFSATGQRWGNPVYRWDVMAQSDYHWWVDRFRAGLSLADVVRLDHFRGFEAYWEISATETNAVNGRWIKGPGIQLFNAVKAGLGELSMIAEDLGVITPEVEALRNQLDLPGMRILQMAFGSDPKARQYLPHNHVSQCVVYTATHDHNTTVGWFTAPPGTQTTQSPREVAEERRHALRYLGTDGKDIHWSLIRLALGSVASWALVPLQDVLGLGTASRMNVPGTLKGNWEWRFTEAMLRSDVTRRLRELTETYERTGE